MHRSPFFSKAKLLGLAGLLAVLAVFCFTLPSCGIYRLSERGSIPDSVKTVRVITFENRAPYQNPQLVPNLTDRLRQKITNQTKLTITNNDNVHWEIAGRIDDYSVTTTGVTSTNGQQQSSINRLSVRVHITINKRIDGKVEEFDVSRSFDFSARQSLQQAEATLLDEMVRNLTDEIFNKLFSDW
jgi:hypothetical protein